MPTAEALGWCAAALMVATFACRDARRIVLAGTATTLYTGSTDDAGFAVVRLNADGTLDTRFGTGGLAVRQIGTGQDTPAALALQADGGILMAGLWLSTATSFDFVVTRFGPDGTPDPVFSFVFDFFAARDGAHDLLVQPDGKVLAAGQAGSGLSVFPMLLRLNP